MKLRDLVARLLEAMPHWGDVEVAYEENGETVPIESAFLAKLQKSHEWNCLFFCGDGGKPTTKRLF